MLKLYHDPLGSNLISNDAPDVIKGAVLENQTFTDIKEIYLLGDPDLTYEDIILLTIGDVDGATQSGEVDITYSLDGENYADVLQIPDGSYDETLTIFRKAVAPNVDTAFKLLEIKHELTFSEYVR